MEVFFGILALLIIAGIFIFLAMDINLKNRIRH